MKYIINIIVLLSILTFSSHADTKNGMLNYDDLLPNKYWKYMIGYKYDYDNPECSVRWNKRTASFLLTGKNCDQLEPNKIKEDAIKSINFITKKMKDQYHIDFESYYAAVDDGTINIKGNNKDYSYPKSNNIHPSRNTNYDYIQMKWQGIGIWIQGCADYASGMGSSKTHADTYQGNKIDKKFPQLKSHLVKQIYDHGWKNAVNVNFYCDTYAEFFIDQLLLSVNDLRK